MEAPASESRKRCYPPLVPQKLKQRFSPRRSSATSSAKHNADSGLDDHKHRASDAESSSSGIHRVWNDFSQLRIGTFLNQHRWRSHSACQSTIAAVTRSIPLPMVEETTCAADSADLSPTAARSGQLSVDTTLANMSTVSSICTAPAGTANVAARYRHKSEGGIFKVVQSVRQTADGQTLKRQLLGTHPSVYANFLRAHKCYDLIPTSSKLVVFDTQLQVKKAFFALVYNGVRAAPLWDGSSRRFVGMLTITDFIFLIHRYYQSKGCKVKELEEHCISTWREVLREAGRLRPLITVSMDQSLYDASCILCEKKVHRLPVVNAVTGNILYIMTHKRILRFLYVYINKAPQPAFLRKTPKELNIGTWDKIHTICQDTTLIEILDRFLTHRISALPVVSSEGKVIDIYAKFDVLNLVASRSFDNLDITVKEVLSYRSQWFEGVRNCTDTDSLEVVIDLLVKSEVHRLVVVNVRSEIKGIVSLSDILSFLVFKSEEVDTQT